jgi:hypothetical protein
MPSRTEAPFTSFRDSDIGSRRSTFEHSTWYDSQSEATNINTYKPPASTDFERATNASSVYNSSSMNQVNLYVLISLYSTVMAIHCSYDYYIDSFR